MTSSISVLMTLIGKWFHHFKAINTTARQATYSSDRLVAAKARSADTAQPQRSAARRRRLRRPARRRCCTRRSSTTDASSLHWPGQHREHQLIDKLRPVVTHGCEAWVSYYWRLAIIDVFQDTDEIPTYWTLTEVLILIEGNVSFTLAGSRPVTLTRHPTRKCTPLKCGATGGC